MYSETCIKTTPGTWDQQNVVLMQLSLYFKTIHGIMEMWSYIAGGLKIKVQQHTKLHFATKIGGLII